MNDIEKRARDALARVYRRQGRDGMAALILNGHVRDSDAELALVIEYMTPPEGYVLVPVEPTADMVQAASKARSSGGAMDEVWAAMLAARPQVP